MEESSLSEKRVIGLISRPNVFLIRFAHLNLRLLVDLRRVRQGAIIALVPPAESVEDRFDMVYALRPDLPRPERIIAFMWPKHVESFLASSVWERIEARMTAAGMELASRCRMMAAQLCRAEVEEGRAAVLGIGYETLWDRHART